MGKRRRGKQEVDNLSKKQKKHLKEFGEQHPFDDHVADRPERIEIVRLVFVFFPDRKKRPEAESEDDSDVEQQSAYQKLLSSMVPCDESEEENGGESEEEEVDDDDDESGQEGDEAEQDLKDEVDNISNEVHENEEGEVDGEFTDKKNEAAFCLETNLPAEEEETKTSAEQDEDMFVKHQEVELSDEEVGRISQGTKIKTQVKWPKLGTLLCTSPLERFPAVLQPSSSPLPPIHKTLQTNWHLLNQAFEPEPGTSAEVTEMQKEMLGIMGSYRDMYFTNISPLKEAKEVRSAYCLHVLNHVLKSNSRVIQNNAKLRETKDVNMDFRDQGLTRPKVLILVPLRDGVLRVVQTFITLMEPKGKTMDVSNKKRFKDEYGEDPDAKPPNLHRPDDYHAIFSGNIDDHFRIGVSVLRGSMKLYAPFYSADIIIASPLGLRTVLGAEGEKSRDYDFLSSIELLIVWSKVIPKMGSICQVLGQLPHVFQMFHSDSFMDHDARFQFFVDKILPQYRDSIMSHTFIYVPSYFDFVRLRNYMKKEDISFASISEYSLKSEVSQARHYFWNGEKQFLLFSERFHFYKRYTIKGIHNLIFYGLPTYPHFYSEVCNMLQAGIREDAAPVSFTCTAMYSRYDAHKLAAITGAERAAQMVQSKKTVHLFITGDENSTKS
ncbi:hypothetical protein DNTS_003729 [Danionella cerebrum]|uniref:UTP25 NTP hydrolase-like domain-containing protein n=1 Tax=Danionella cerebrum TaxID=2873325 RepID=A0A553N3Z4_9TELE|nr:hypothetical protein DNTS_003729 [Danionella translucida]